MAVLHCEATGAYAVSLKAWAGERALVMRGPSQKIKLLGL